MRKATFIPCLVMILLLPWPLLAGAQEINYIDLVTVQQRTELRHPPAPPASGHGLGGAIGGASVVDGAPDLRDPRALGVYLLYVTPTEIDPQEPFETEFKVLNTGRVAIEIPVHPHLSDLQPSDESVAFSYLSLALVVQGDGTPQVPEVSALGFVELYGSHAYEGSVMELRPGEWIRVRAVVKLRTWPTEPVFANFRGNFWLRRNTF